MVLAGNEIQVAAMNELIIAGVVFLAGIVIAFWRGAASSDRKQKAKERDSYARHLEEISGAHDARNRAGSVQPDDPNRRD